MTDPNAEARFVGHYTFERADYGALIDAMRRGSWGLRTILVMVWLSVLVLIIGLSSRDWTQFVQVMGDLVTLHDVPPFIYGVIASVLVLIALLPRITKWRALRAYPSFSVADETIDIILDETGFTSTAKGRRGQMDWTRVRQVLVAPEHLILAFSKREAFCVPKRAFASELEFAAVAALARRKVPAVQPK
jgi:YcxB-like protein